MFQSLGQCDKPIEYLQKAVVITTEIGNREGEATIYVNLGTVFQSLGQCDKAIEYLQKAIVVKSEIGDRKGEVSCYGNLGTATRLKKISKKRLLSNPKLAIEKDR